MLPDGISPRSSGYVAAPMELTRKRYRGQPRRRQIFYLFFGGAVIVGLVFVLGVIGRPARRGGAGMSKRAQTQAADRSVVRARIGSRGGAGCRFRARTWRDGPVANVDKTIGENREAA